MHKFALAAVLALLISSPAHAGIRNCTAALVSANVCPVADTRDAFTASWTDANMDHLVRSAARKAGWTNTVECTAALVTDGACTSAQIGTQIPFACTSALVAQGLCRQAKLGQPLQKRDVAFAYLRNLLETDFIVSEQAEDINAAKRAEAAAAVGAIAKPDGGD